MTINAVEQAQRMPIKEMAVAKRPFCMLSERV
jgi:hypothetical protein